MSNSTDRTDIDALAELPGDELTKRVEEAALRIETRQARCYDQSRDLSKRELDLTNDDRAELEALRQALAIQEHYQRNLSIIDNAIQQHNRPTTPVWRPTLLVSEINLRSMSDALREGRPFGAVEKIETRSLVTAGSDMGSAGAWNAGAPNEPRNLIRFSGVPVSPLTGKTAQLPKYTGPTGVSGHDEGSDHDEYDTVDKVDLTAKRYGRWTEVSSVVGELDDLRGINVMHSWGIARDLDKLAIGVIETAASTPENMGNDLEGVVREALLTVQAETYSDAAQLVIVGAPADVALLTGTSPTSGTDVESYAVRFNGARLYASNEASAGQVTCFAPQSFRVFQSPLQSALVIDPTDGGHKFGSWLHSTELGVQIVGAALAVATSGS